MKPICVRCQRFYRPKQNGIWFIEGMPIYNGAPRGRDANPEHWKPYKIWQGDLWECHGCGHELISGIGHHAARVQHQEDFEEFVKECNPIVQVNDC